MTDVRRLFLKAELSGKEVLFFDLLQGLLVQLISSGADVPQSCCFFFPGENRRLPFLAEGQRSRVMCILTLATMRGSVKKTAVLLALFSLCPGHPDLTVQRVGKMSTVVFTKGNTLKSLVML